MNNDAALDAKEKALLAVEKWLTENLKKIKAERKALMVIRKKKEKEQIQLAKKATRKAKSKAKRKPIMNLRDPDPDFFDVGWDNMEFDMGIVVSGQCCMFQSLRKQFYGT